MVYNHSDFLEKTLDSILSQETTFSFEVVIHDDKSTDSSISIIKEYQKKYPHIIKPILELENQYSKGFDNFREVVKGINSQLKGKYIAFCEGDDCWCDSSKLQKQYCVMEANPNYSMCVHNTMKHYLDSSKEDELFNNWVDAHVLSADQIFKGWKIHATSYFVKKEYLMLPGFNYCYWFGDYVLFTLSYSCGPIYYIPDVMSVYNAVNPKGITYQNGHDSFLKAIEKEHLRVDYLKKYDEYTDKKYHDLIEKYINEFEFDYLVSKFNYFLIGGLDIKEGELLANQISSSPHYEVIMSEKSGITKIKEKIKYEGYKFKPLWLLIIKSWRAFGRR